MVTHAILAWKSHRDNPWDVIYQATPHHTWGLPLGSDTTRLDRLLFHLVLSTTYRYSRHSPVILDEFQRFRHLLDLTEGGEAAELAHHLFDYGDAKVLLSATPYKPFTLAEEAAAGEDHHRDFLRTLNFLNGEPGWNEEVRHAFDTYREAVVGGMNAERATHELRRLLLQVMCRTERRHSYRARCCSTASSWRATYGRSGCEDTSP